MLAYQAAAAAAKDVSTELNRAAKIRKHLLILTAADISAFGALEVVLAQGNLLNAKLKNTRTLVQSHCNPPARADIGPLQLGSTTAAAVAAWINVVSSLSQVKESTTPMQVTIADTTLVQMIAAQTSHGSVIVPSVYLATSTSPASTPGSIANLLDMLDASQQDLDKAAVSIASTKLCALSTSLGKAVSHQISSLDNSVAAFESTLIPSSQSGQGSATFGQILYADHVVSAVNPDGQTQYELAFVHAVDAGGTNLTRQTTLLGTRQYYSGGAIATYSLFNSTGQLECMGIAYGYRGFVAAGDVGTAIGDGKWMGASSSSNAGNKLPDTSTYVSQNCPSPP